MEKILVAMSGGVDSTIVAYTLKNQGYMVEGAYMKLHNSPLYHQENIKKVEKVANFLGIKYHILDLEDSFNEAVFFPFIDTYKSGLTPNPCLLCNRNIKLGKLLDFAKSRGFDYLATGHYAKIRDGFIVEATDKSKDQSYFLSNIKKDVLEFIKFPLGDRFKEDVKKEASKIEVLKSFATQKESSEICFVDETYLEVLDDYTDIDIPGDLLDLDGNVIGRHRGYMHYTIGKRKGFTVFGALDPHYVLSIDAKKNQVTVGKREDLNVYSFLVKDLNMFIDDKRFDSLVKIRHKSPKSACEVSIDGNRATVTLFKALQGVAPGQAAVFYDDDKVIGSGWIEGEIKDG